MPDSGSGLFTDIEEYRAALPVAAELLVLHPSRFRALLTVGKLPYMGLLRACEATARVAYLRLGHAHAVVSFPISRNSSLVYNGLELRHGELVFHQPGESFHQRITGESCWGVISTSAAYLASSSRAVLGRTVRPPRITRIVTPRPLDYTALLRLHARAGRLAETNLSRIAHPEVARALNQDLLLAFLACLSAGRSRRLPPTCRRHVKLLAGFEDGMAEQSGLLTPAELTEAAQVSGRTLQACSARVLGMDPHSYQIRKRLRRIELALLRTVTAGGVLEDAAKQHGFSGVQQFEDGYRSAYGEASSVFLSHGM